MPKREGVCKGTLCHADEGSGQRGSCQSGEPVSGDTSKPVRHLNGEPQNQRSKQGEDNMSLGVLNNIAAVYATNNLNNTQLGLQNTLDQLSSGQRINSGADDAAGLSLADGLDASSTALSQSTNNADEGVDFLQVADGGLAQITSLLNRAVTLATEAGNGTLSTSQITAANAEYLNIQTEITDISNDTEYNGLNVYTKAANVYTSDGTLSQSYDTTALGATDSATLGLTAAGFTTSAAAQTEEALITAAISTVAAERGTEGADVNQLQAVSNVESTESTNTLSAENDVIATNYATATSNLSKYEILNQAGISALAQANSAEQEVSKLLQ
jgi:flagellin